MGGRLVALTLALTVAGCSGCGKPALRAPGGSAQRGGSTGGLEVTPGVTRLCDVTPEGDRSRHWKDGTPIVLWAGSAPAAVLQYRRDADVYGSYGPAYVAQSLAVVDGAAKRGPFPLEVRVAVTPEMTGDDEPRGRLWPENLATADVDGDGREELVTFRYSREVEVHGLSGQHWRLDGRGGAPLWPHRIRLGAREVLLVGMRPSSEQRRRGLRPAVLRIDERGVRRIELEGMAPDAELLEVGSVVREGAADLDELVALWAWKNEGYLSRHRADGKAIDAPRKIYVEFPWYMGGGEVIGMPLSQRNVLLDGKTRAAIFLAPTKPVNWVRRADVSALPEKEFFAVGAIDERGGAKAVFRSGPDLYAVNEDGAWLTWEEGRWVPHEKPVPYLRLPAPAEGEVIRDVIASSRRADEVLAVYTRDASLRVLARDEIVAAGKRFLFPEEVRAFERERFPELEGRDSRRDELIAAERARRGVGVSITSLEEWKRLLPDSFAAMSAVAEEEAYDRMKAALAPPRNMDHVDESTRDAYRAWLRSVEVAPETKLVLARRASVVGRWTIAAHALRTESDLPLEHVDFRTSDRDVTVLLPLEKAGGAAREGPGMFLARFTR